MTGQEWFTEVGAERRIQYRVEKRVYSGRSQYQIIDIVDTLEYGRMLFLDNVAQSAQRSEFIYHETLVHPGALIHPNPKNACVIGGAEGATVREIFKHPSIERVVMVDIDGKLVDLCREHLPDWNGGAFEDPRLELVIGDGRAYLENSRELFDLIVIDLPDPVEDSPAIYLFTQEFYRAIKDRLTPEGVASFQGESLQPWRVQLHAQMVNTLKSVFSVVQGYPYFQPDFHELHAQILVTQKSDPRKMDWGRPIAERNLELDYLSPEYLKGLFQMPRYVEKAYERFPEVLTDQKPFVVLDRF